MNRRNLLRFPYEHVLLAVMLMLALLLPDLLMALVDGYVVAPTPGPLALALLLLFCLALTEANRWLAGALLVLILLLQLIQVSFLAYFRAPMEPPALYLAWMERHEVSAGVGGEFARYQHVLWYLALPWLLFLAAFVRWCHHAPVHRNATLIVLLFLPVGPLLARLQDNPSGLMPDRDAPAIINTYKAQSLFLGRILPDVLQGTAPRTVTPHPLTTSALPVPLPSNRVVVLVIGESISSDRFSLVNPHYRSTTPQLQALADSGAAMHWGSSWAAGVNTRSSVYALLEGLRDPRNHLAWQRGDGNLFRLAKSRGFTTHLYSAQYRDMLHGLHERWIDHREDREQNNMTFERRRDRLLVDKLHALDLSGRQFIVLHMRAAHYPYALNYHAEPDVARYPGHNDAHQPKPAYPDIDDYDNALRYSDRLLADMIHDLQARAPGEAILLYTADHGELFGEDGLNGHTQMHPAPCRTPFMLWSNSPEPVIAAREQLPLQPSAFRLSQLTAHYMGTQLHDPGDRRDEVLINGPLAGGLAGVVQLRVDNAGNLLGYTRRF